jgi:hypothetical protein
MIVRNWPFFMHVLLVFFFHFMILVAVVDVFMYESPMHKEEDPEHYAV